MKFWINHKTRFCKITTGPIESSETTGQGFIEVSESEMESFRSVTSELLKLGWSKSPRTLKKYLGIYNKKWENVTVDSIVEDKE